eukprot:Lankesteria_metandrocarpae@DN5029_c0_g1_i1.p1
MPVVTQLSVINLFTNMARKSISTTHKSPRVARSAACASEVTKEDESVSFATKFRLRRFLILVVLSGAVTVVAMHGKNFGDVTLEVKSTFPVVVSMISKCLERVSESLLAFEHLQGNVTANSFRASLSELRREYGFWTVNVGVALVTLALIGLLLLITSRTGRKTIKERKKRRRSTTGVRVVLSGSDVELSDESEDEQHGESADEKLIGPDVIFVEKKLSKEEYDVQTQATTNTEVVKLLKSQEFRQLLKERGKDQDSFNWQSRRSARLAGRSTGSAPPVSR